MSNRPGVMRSLFAFGALFGLIGSFIFLTSMAATPTADINLGVGSTVTSPATIINDAAAAGGSAVQFQAASPGETSRCPAYPAFPDASCTGPTSNPASLNDCSTSKELKTNGASYANCKFTNGVLIYANNIKISNSIIYGPVTDGGNSTGLRGLTLTDVEVDGTWGGRYNGTENYAGIGGDNFTCTRCNVHHFPMAFAFSNYSVIDSYVHDLYGYPVNGNANDPSHNEAVYACSNNTITHNRLDAEFSSTSTGGAMSAAIAIYSHGVCSSAVNVKVQQNYIKSNTPVYCVYAGYFSGANPRNIQFTDNVFAKSHCGQSLVVGWLTNASSGIANNYIWLNNTYDDATSTVIPEPPTGSYR